MNAPPPRLPDLRPCLEGAIPAIMATSAIDGTPNVAYLSQVFYVDERHVALSFQFFNKTRQNILVNPRATVLVMNPLTAQFYRLHLRYLRTESGGPVFERMKAQLAGIASYTGLEDVFRLLGSDIYEVLEIERVPGEPLPTPEPRCGLLGGLRCASERLAACTSLAELLDSTLVLLRDVLDMPHAMVLMLDEATGRLYTVASTGYPTSGVGSEIELGDGVIGVAGRERTAVRIVHMTSAYLYGRAVRERLEGGQGVVTEIPYPGLAEPHSQMAVPMVSGGRLLGVVFVESPQDMRFGFEDEDILVALAGQLAASIDLMHASTECGDVLPLPGAPARARPVRGPALKVRHFRANDSVFLNDTYLIKGVAGAILCKLLRDHLAHGRTEFSNRELRLDTGLGLPDVSDNLEARLLLLQRRLQEHGPDLRLEKTGRGRFRLQLTRPVELVQIDGAA